MGLNDHRAISDAKLIAILVRTGDSYREDRPGV